MRRSPRHEQEPGKRWYGLRQRCFLFHQKLDFVSLSLGAGAVCDTVHSSVVAADDLLTGSLAACLIIDNAVSGHVDTHVCRGFVRALAENLLEDRAQNRENLNITVVVDGCHAVCLEVERSIMLTSFRSAVAAS